MQEYAEDNPGRCFAVYANPGDVVIVPPYWAHATISANPDKPLTFGAWCDREYGFVYEGVRKHNGIAWYPVFDELNEIQWLENPAYQPSELICKSPADYLELGIKKDKSIYCTFEEDPETFLFVPSPQIKEEYWRRFIPYRDFIYNLNTMKTEHNKMLIYIIAMIAATGGLLFGFDTGVISGAIPFFQKDFGIDNNMIELITSAGLLGAILGALFCGRLTDRLGRKKVILASAVIFAVGAIWSGVAVDAWNLVLARLFLGIAIGVSSFAVPLYIAEISPAKVRGMFVSMFQLMVTIGVLVSYLSDLYFADEGDMSCWRPMFYVGVIPACILLVGMIFMPETPRWLMSKGRHSESIRILKRIEGEEQAKDSFQQMQEEIKRSETEKSGWKELLQPWLRTPLIICIGIMFFQQFVGINTVIYYSPKIFLMAGFDGTVAAIWASVGVGVVNVIFTVVSVYFVDRLGRRKLYFIGLSGIVVSLLILGLCFVFVNQLGDSVKWVAILLIFCYVAFFAISIGPLGWLIISEIFPLKLRGLGASLGSLSVWLFNSIVSFTFFKIVKALTIPGKEIILDGENLGNPAGAFWFYGGVAFLALIWGYFYVPETKGVSLEQIENFWRKRESPRKLK